MALIPHTNLKARNQPLGPMSAHDTNTVAASTAAAGGAVFTLPYLRQFVNAGWWVLKGVCLETPLGIPECHKAAQQTHTPRQQH
jgi:hypothetical protein